MNIEITEKEKTALSILLGLRQKFSREKKDHKSYSASELHKLFSELISQINKGELRFLDTLQVIHTPARPRDEVWGEIDDAIERSKIRRFDWDKVFGKSLTQEILLLKKQGLNVSDTFATLSTDPRVFEFIEENKRSKIKILENLKISIHARFGENNTAQKIMGERK
jgi:hypothetical protein